MMPLAVSTAAHSEGAPVRSRDENVLPSLSKDIATMGDAMPFVPSNGDQLAAHCHHRCFRGDGPSLPVRDLLATIYGRDRGAQCAFSTQIDCREFKYLMPVKDKSTHNGFSHISNEEEWPGIVSRYRLIVVAALRSKQLLQGSLPRIAADPRRRRNTSIALEEVKRGLVHFTVDDEDQKENGNGHG